jgi:hypothetical protein
MMRFDGKSQDRASGRLTERAQPVVMPLQHQGIQDALRGAFHDALDTPADLQALLSRIR